MDTVCRFAAATAALLAWLLCAPARADALLRFPDIRNDRVLFTYAGDLWTVSAAGGTAARLTTHPGLELFGKFSPDGRYIAFTGQYGGDEQVYVIPVDGGAPRQLTFYPARGPLPDRWGFDNQVYGWTPDGGAILFRSARDAHSLVDSRLYTVPFAGGAAQPLPMPSSGAGQFSPNGRRIVYCPLWRDFRAEKHYQGGWANALYLFDLRQSRVERLTRDRHTNRDPMWIGEAVYFNSDRGGTFNLYRRDLADGRVSQLTHHERWNVRWPSADAAGHIVYELHGGLRIYDTRTGTDQALQITVPADDTSHLPQAVDAAEAFEDMTLSPGGERAAVVARGDVFTVPMQQGVTRNLTHSSNAHEREAAWSTDGTRLAYVSDASGEEQLLVQRQDGVGPAIAVTSGYHSRYNAPRWAPGDRRIALADHSGRLYVVPSTGGARVPVAKDPLELAHDYQWSPDGRFLAYALHDPNGFSALYIWSVEDGASRRVTPEYFEARSPAWAPDGQLLYFLSAREYRPILSGVEFDFATDRQIGVFALALRGDSDNPFGVRDQEPGGDGVAAPKRPRNEQDGRRAPITIDFAGITGRTIRVPLEADDLSELRATDEALLYLRSGPSYDGRESSSKPTLMAYSIKDREARPVIEDVKQWAATADGRHVLVRSSSGELKYVEVGKSDDARSVSLAGLATTRIPAEEWHEIFIEAWRRYRDYFYVANMHGYDWEALRRQYEPLVGKIGHRADLNYVIAEMIAELSVQHAYVEGGDLGLPKRPFVALPGARFELDRASGRYRIARILAGQNEEPLYRSPLTEVGVRARVGDYVLAINGRELTAATDPYELLRAPADLPVEWRVAADAAGHHARTIRYRPLASEAPLLYLAWVTANRERVERQSGGRLGYIHLPDMGASGLAEFIKWWYPQVRKEGLVVDVRDNGGGNVSQMLIERLARTLHGTNFGRHQDLASTYPQAEQSGPKAALVNEATASDGDLFANAFRQWGIGPLIGKRTWGGVVGIADHGPLLDGGRIFVPEFAAADAQGRWIIEGTGVAPDIEVEQDPVEVLRGHDPQLERAVTELLARLPAEPGGLPKRPTAPDKAREH